ERIDVVDPRVGIRHDETQARARQLLGELSGHPTSLDSTCRHVPRDHGHQYTLSEKLPSGRPCRFDKGMEKTCDACGQQFQPAFVFQIAVTADGRRNHYCSLECRKTGLGDEALRAKRARRIAILNQKGGTGKTTTAVNLAAGLAERDHEVLLIDTDAQGNVGVSLGVAGERSLYHVLVEGIDPTEVAVPVRGNLDVITSDATLAAAEIWLARQSTEQRSRILTKRLNGMAISRRYDHII